MNSRTWEEQNIIIGLLLEWYCDVQRNKIAYNTMIDNEKQMNLFRDFGVK